MPKDKGYHFKCAKCKKPVDEENYCFGCKQHICEKCCEPTWGNEPMGNHAVSAHWTPFDESDDL